MKVTFMHQIYLVCSLLAKVTLTYSNNMPNHFVDLFLTHHDGEQDSKANLNVCSTRVYSSLEKLRRREASLRSSAVIDLSGYALHQPLRLAPYDMYVTNIRVRTPSVGDWARVSKCDFSTSEQRITSLIRFNSLTVTGTVQLLAAEELLNNPMSLHHHPQPCNITLRLNRAGLGIQAIPTRGRNKEILVRTEARIVDPHLLAVHLHGCGFRNNNHLKMEERTDGMEQESASATAQLRIITLDTSLNHPEMHSLELHEANFHKERILGLHSLHLTPQKLQTLAQVHNAIQQQTNEALQANGPFSSTLTMTEPQPHHYTKPTQPHDKIVNTPLPTNELLQEIQQIFFKGIKTLLAKYLEKKLETPLREALLLNIGYTISYG